MLASNEINIENFIISSLGPVSYDFSLNEEVRYIKNKKFSLNKTIDITKPDNFGRFKKLPVILKKGDVIIFSSKEKITLPPYISGIVYARSSLTKLPILFNIPGLIDPGFSGSISGVIYNFSSRKLLIKEMRICQVVLHLHNTVKEHYGVRRISKNQNQYGKNSLMSKTDFEFK